MINTHASAVTQFQNEATSGQDGELKAFAAQWLTTIQHHLEMAEALPQVK